MKKFLIGQVEVITSKYAREGEYIFIGNSKGKNKMSSLKRKIEIDKLIEDFIGSFRAELEQIDNDFCFITEDDDEIHSRLYCLRHVVPVVLPKEEGFNIGDVTETLPNANEYKLRFFGDLCLEGDELNRFFDYMDRVKKEVQGS